MDGMLMWKKAMTISSLTMAVVAGVLLASVTLVRAQTGAAGADGPVARPDLALSLQDLPALYEEVEGLGLSLGSVPLQDRVLRRTQQGAGPAWIWTMTYETAGRVTHGRVQSLAVDLAVTASRLLGSRGELTNWSVEDASGLGQYATMYSFDYRIYETDAVGDGVLAIFGPGPYMSYLIAISPDTQVLSEARQLAAIINARTR